MTTKQPQIGKISDQEIEELRRTIGSERPMHQYNTMATEDTVGHYVLGAGDDNPRWLDPVHAANTPWGGIIAPATFVQTCGFPRARGLPGVHGLFSGVDFRCHQPIKIGTRITAGTALHELKERIGEFGGRQFQQTYATNYRDDQGTILTTLYSHTFRVERRETEKDRKYGDITPQSYTEAELAPIEANYKAELVNRRGKRTRYLDEISVGEALPDVVKGPLTVTDCICFVSGFGWVYAMPHRQWYEYRQRHPGVGSKNRYGIWDVPERVHWEEDYAKAVGMPTMFDYGPQRAAWFDHAVSDWMSDAGWIRRLHCTFRAPNFIGDTTWIRGSVVKKSVEDGCVELELRSVDQRGRTTAIGGAEVVLPKR